MPVHDYVQIDTNELPEQFDMNLSNTDYTFKVSYDDVSDSYHISIYDENMIPIVTGERLVYGMPLFSHVQDPRLPIEDIVPWDERNQEQSVNASTLEKSVFLIISADFPDNDNDVPNDDTDDHTGGDINDYGNDRTVK